MPKLAICVDTMGWWHKFERYAGRAGLDYAIVEIERSDWIEQVQSCSAILWRPNLDPPFCEEAREKLYLLERVLAKKVVPNWNTFWHYDNKRGQSYIFAAHGIPTPCTFVSFSMEDTLRAIRHLRFPLVSKTSSGAASTGVRLLRTPGDARREARQVFHVGVLAKGLARLGVDLRWSSRTRNRYVLWQEFIEGNERDLRITVIGKDHIFAFWRNNRRGDFRASGSGSIDYAVTNVEKECLYCAELCRRHGFDTMAFDIVYKDGNFLVLEMSYAYNDAAIYGAPRHFRHGPNGRLSVVEGQVWPQELMIEYVEQLMRDDHACQRTTSNVSSNGE